MTNETLENLESLVTRGWCWTLGRDRHFPERIFCRIYPRREFYGPVVTTYDKTADKAAEACIAKLVEKTKEFTPERTPGT